MDKLLKLLDDKIDYLFLLFIDEKVAHNCLILMLQLEEDVGKGHV